MMKKIIKSTYLFLGILSIGIRVNGLVLASNGIPAYNGSVGDIDPIKVSGKVIDEFKSPIPGVNILIKGTTEGTATDAKGDYTLMIPENAILVFSFIGYETQEVSVAGRSVVNVQLAPDIGVLDEVIVVGYGVQKKADVTGAISSIEGEDLSKSPLSGVDQAMQGLAAGVRVTQNTGAPGEGVTVRIRGVGSINSDNAPLYIVDGLPTKDAMNFISTADIESISILKDASSAAIYGSRANNGVVLITTKKGAKGGTPRITYNSSMGIQQHGKITEMTDKEEYITLYNEAAGNDNANIDNPRLQRKLITEDISAGLADIDHLDAIFQAAKLQNHYLGVSGGSEKSQYNISGSYFDQEGIILGSDFQRLTGKVSVSTQANDWFNIGANLNVSRSKRNIIGSSGDGFGGNGGSVIRYAFFRTPTIPIFDEDGNFVDLPNQPEFFGDGYNPIGLADNTHNIRKENRIFGNVNIGISFTDKLQFNTTFGIDNNNFNQRRFDKTWGANDRINNPNTLTVDNGSTFNWSLTNHLNYSTSVNNVHHITALLGTETIQNDGNNTQTREKDFPDQNLSLINLGGGQGIVTAFESIWEYKLLSFFARINYNYNEKYFLTAIFRRDGSSRFSKNNRWGNFPSASAGWRLDKEPFLKNSAILDQWKLRVGFGAVGNQEIDNFAFLEQITAGRQYPFGDVPQDGYATAIKGNEDLRWETSKQWDFGTDLSFFEGKLSLTLDYFHKITEDMLFKEPLPSSEGYAEPSWTNKGKVLNSGIELEIGYHQQTGNFKYSIKANVSRLHNEVLELAAPILGGRIDNGVFATKTQEGHEIGAFFLYEMEGIFQNETEIITHAFQGSQVKPGDIKYKDQNGDGVIDEQDRKIAGDPIPDIVYGINFNLEYKNFDMSIFLQGAHGQDIYNQINTDVEGFYRPFNLTQRYYDERWTGEGTSNTQPRASWGAKANNTRASTRFLEDGSYLRLRNLQIGYSIPKGLLSNVSIENLRLYFSGNNLLTFTKYTGLDPDITVSDNSLGEGDRASGIDWATYPTAISYNMGIQLTF